MHTPEGWVFDWMCLQATLLQAFGCYPVKKCKIWNNATARERMEIFQLSKWYSGQISFVYASLENMSCGTSLKCPLILTSDFLLFLRCEVILDVESLANFLWSFAFDHVSDCLTCQVQKILDVEIVCSLLTEVQLTVSFWKPPQASGVSFLTRLRWRLSLYL